MKPAPPVTRMRMSAHSEERGARRLARAERRARCLCRCGNRRNMACGRAFCKACPLSASFFFSPLWPWFALVRLRSTAPEPQSPSSRTTRRNGPCGCYGNKESITPNMDRIAKKARVRECLRSHAGLLAEPCQLLTGIWNTQLAITDWIAPTSSAPASVFRRAPSSGRKCSRKTAGPPRSSANGTLGEKPHNVPANGLRSFLTASSAAGTPHESHL